MTPIGFYEMTIYDVPLFRPDRKKSAIYRTCYLHFRVFFFSDLYKFSVYKATRTFRFSFVSVGCHYNKNHDGSLISINLRDCIETGWKVCCCFPNILIMFIALKSCGEFRRGCRVRAR